MKFNTNTILSYFIKDIKDPKELAFYKGIKTRKTIQIFYKDELLYEIDSKDIFNYKTNICKTFYSYCNYKLYSYKTTNYKYKYLYYKNNNKIAVFNPYYIGYLYKQNKYLKKLVINYCSQNAYLINNKINYYKGYKYIFKDNEEDICKFSHSLIFIIDILLF